MPPIDTRAHAMKVSSTGFGDGQFIPPRYTADGENRSPPIHWTDPPAGTRSLALVCEDPDAPGGTFVHWVAWNVPPDRHDLPEGLRPAPHVDGMTQGRNDFGRNGYGGPRPPPGGPHRYRFHVYALDDKLDLEGDASMEELEGAIAGHVLGEGVLTGKYQRPR